MTPKPPDSKTPDSNPNHIRSPRRLLTLTPTSHSLTIIPPFLHSLTGVAVSDPPTTTTTTTHPPATDSSSPAPAEPTPTFAGYTTHPPLHLENKYYTADVPIWVDEIPLSTATVSPSTGDESTSSSETSPAKWRAEFSSDEALPVRDAIGALVVCVRNPSVPPSASAPVGDAQAQSVTAAENHPDVEGIKSLMKAVGDVKSLIEEERSDGGDVLTLLVLVGDAPSSAAPTGTSAAATAGEVGDIDGNDGGSLDDEPFSELWWEDQMFEMGLVGVEVVRWDPKIPESESGVRNAFGEYQGMMRIREVLETHDWNASSEDPSSGGGGGGVGHGDDDLEKYLLGLDGDGNGGGSDLDEDTGFGLEVNELEREMVGLRMAIEKGGDVGLLDSEVGVDSEGAGGGEDEDDLRVDSLEGLMLRMQAIKDMSAELPEQERKRFAARAVRDIMKEV